MEHDGSPMRYLSFRVGVDYYAIKLHQLIDVVPAVPLKQLPESPAWMPGLLRFHHQVVPVIDLCQLVTGKPAAANLGTRIVLIPCRQDASADDTIAHDDEQHCFGVMAEAMTGTIDDRDLTAPPEDSPVQQSAWLGEIACYGDQLVQLVEPHALMTDEVRDLLQLQSQQGQA